MKVTVLIITYNHEKYIRQTIDSVLSQQTNFPFEILIGDDASTDATSEIIKEYQQRFPEIVVSFLHQKNLGQNGLINTIETIQHARGEYIAALDGDDYWTDNFKLQKQVDFLDKNPTFSACFHNSKIIYFEGEKIDYVNNDTQKEIVGMDDLIGEDEIWFMATSSVVFRNCIESYPAWFRKSISGDIPRYILLANKGNIKYLPEVMSVYRKHLSGTSFSDNYKKASFLKNRIEMYEGINLETNFVYNKTIKKNIARYYEMMLESDEYITSYWGRVKVILKIFSLKKVTQSKVKHFLKEYVVPKELLKVYSFFALLPYRLKNIGKH